GPKAGCYIVGPGAPGGGQEFQSSSGPKAGCYVVRTTLIGLSSVFQSSSGPKAGWYTVVLSRAEPMAGFNPHPARRPDATTCQQTARKAFMRFQSSSGPKAGCY